MYIVCTFRRTHVYFNQSTRTITQDETDGQTDNRQTTVVLHEVANRQTNKRRENITALERRSPL